MADASINIELKGIAKLKKDLRELKDQLAEATDPQQMAELAAKAGELSDKISDANEKIGVFAAGTPFEKTNNALGLMGSQLASLDFEGAAESAKSFAVATKGITREQIGEQFKSLGGVIGGLTKGFLTLGKAILLNPIFLIGAAIAAVVTAIAALLNKFGLLKPILKAVGDAFKFVGQVIDGVVQSIKDFIDWLGGVDVQAQKSAEIQQKAAEKSAEAREKEAARTVKSYDRKIAIAKAEGKSTVELEKEKQRAIAATESARYKDLVAALEAAKKKGDVDQEEIKKLKEKALAAKENASQARFELQLINTQETADKKKALEEQQKAQQEAYKKAAEKRREEYEKRKAEEKAFNEWLLENQRELLEESQKAIETFDFTENILPAPEEFEDQFNGLVDVAAEQFSAFDNLRFAFSENFKESFDGTLGAADAMFSGMAALAEAFAGSSEESARKAFNIQKVANIAQATMDTYKGAVGAFTQAVSTYPAPLGQIIGGVQAAATVAMGIANIKKIASQQFAGSGNVSANTGGGGGATATTPATPSLNLFGQNNNANNLSAAQSMESGQNITVTAVVSETEMTNTQNKVKKIQQAASL